MIAREESIGDAVEISDFRPIRDRSSPVCVCE